MFSNSIKSSSNSWTKRLNTYLKCQRKYKKSFRGLQEEDRIINSFYPKNDSRDILQGTLFSGRLLSKQKNKAALLLSEHFRIKGDSWRRFWAWFSKLVLSTELVFSKEMLLNKLGLEFRIRTWVILWVARKHGLLCLLFSTCRSSLQPPLKRRKRQGYKEDPFIFVETENPLMKSIL